MSEFRSGFAGLLGPTNVGKSTFLNAVIGEKILITSPKPQTTRNRVRCIYTDGEMQIVFIDTPGLHRPRSRLGKHMLRQAYRSLRGLDVLIYMIEPWREVRDRDEQFLISLGKRKMPTILLVNKIDLARGDDLERTLTSYEATGLFAELIPLSALKRLNLEDTLETIGKYLPKRKPYFPASTKSDSSEKFLVGELIREKIVRTTSQEIPYNTAVRVKWIGEREDGLIEIKAEVLTDKKSQKGIIIGKKGMMIRKIGADARKDIEVLLGRHVFLELIVAEDKDWTRDANRIERLTGDYGGD